MRRHYVRVGILWFVLTFIAEFLAQIYVLPPQLSDTAEHVDSAFRVLVILGLPVFTFIVAVMAYTLFNFRARGDNLEAGETIHGNNVFSLMWTVITGTLCIIVIIHPGLTGLAALAAEPNETDLVVQVTGSQWAWRAVYPQYGGKSVFRAAGGVTDEAMVLPVDRRVRFELTTVDADVLHSFWIPAFRLKKDAMPGRITTMYVTPTEMGSYQENPMLRVQCAEMCGLRHADMMLPIRIVDQAEFDAWVGAPTAEAQAEAPEAAEATPAERGQKLAEENACLGCHSTDGSVLVGPSWLGVYGSQETLADGTTVIVDEEYLRRSILDPNAQIVQGFQPNLMVQTFGDTLTEDQINDLIAYIKSLAK
ncbi:MAG: cytochrome c oxidase subunit II [Anaerolineae bacterium]